MLLYTHVCGHVLPNNRECMFTYLHKDGCCNFPLCHCHVFPLLSYSIQLSSSLQKPDPCHFSSDSICSVHAACVIDCVCCISVCALVYVSLTEHVTSVNMQSKYTSLAACITPHSQHAQYSQRCSVSAWVCCSVSAWACCSVSAWACCGVSAWAQCQSKYTSLAACINLHSHQYSPLATELHQPGLCADNEAAKEEVIPGQGYSSFEFFFEICSPCGEPSDMDTFVSRQLILELDKIYRTLPQDQVQHVLHLKFTEFFSNSQKPCPKIR